MGKRFASREAIGYLEAALALVARLPADDEGRRRELELRLPLGTALSDIHGFASEQVRDNYAITYGVDPLIAASGHSAIALWFLGNPERARTSAYATVTRARKTGHFLTLAGALMQAALVELLCRKTAEGGDLAEESMAVSAEHGFAFWHAMASALGGWALVQQGRALEGLAVVEGTLAAMQATGTRLFSNYVYIFLAEGHLRAGAFADGLAAADACLTVTETILDCGGGPELWRLKGELLAAQSKAQDPMSNAKAGHKRPDPAGQAEACFQRAL